MRNYKKPTAILTGDTHIREDTPVCRVDDFFAAQTRKLDWLADLQRQYDCPILNSGDLFHHWKPSPYLLQYALKHLPDKMIVIPGNHDLPAHSLESYNKCGLGVLSEAGKIQVILDDNTYCLNDPIRFEGFPWGSAPHPTQAKPPTNVAVIHIFTYVGRSPWPGCTAPGAHTLLKQMGGYDLVLSGDNHKPFIIEEDNRLLVNPGSLMRTTSDQAEHKPRVYLWYADTNTVEPVYVPIEENVVSRGHLEKNEARDERMTAFIESLGGEFEISLSFEKNLTEFLATNRVRQSTKTLLWSCVKGE
jgi:DNA repair exonuclease SbcCD nuclease subunit